jgi:hypothetical protein
MRPIQKSLKRLLKQVDQMEMDYRDGNIRRGNRTRRAVRHHIVKLIERWPGDP